MSSRVPLPPRNYNSPAIQAIVDEWEKMRPAWEAEQRWQDVKNRERILAQRSAAAFSKAKRAEWAAGVAKIMAEVRRRETMRAIAEFGL